MSWPKIDSKTQMRLNVLRHRQKLLKLLENTDDMFLKPRIIFDPTDFDKLLSKSIKKEPLTNDIKVKKEPIFNDVKIKKEPVDEPYEPYDSEDDISVGSSEGWNNTPAVRKIDDRRRSKSFISIPYNYENPINALTEDREYIHQTIWYSTFARVTNYILFL